MASIDHEQLEDGLRIFAAEVEADPGLRAEFEHSRERFFSGPELPGADSGARDLAARRHLEWFLFERESEQLGGIPAQEMLPAWRERAHRENPSLLDREEAWLATHTGVFEITSVEPEVGAWLHDLAGFGEFPVHDPTGSRVFETGDLVVGRIYPTDEMRFTISPAAGFFRNADLRTALRRDLDRHRERTDRRVLRLAQEELENMFWRAPHEPDAPDAPLDPVGDARGFLRAEGLDPRTIDGLLERLAIAPFEPDALVHGGGDALGEMLDALAFDTDVDLARARAVLWHAWAALAAPLPVEPLDEDPAPGPDAVRAAIADFDADRARGVGVDESIAALERKLGLSEVEDDDEDATAPDFPGAVEAMVEEFLWERGALGTPELERPAEQLRRLGRVGEPVGVFENLGARDLLLFAGWWVLEKDVLGDESEVQPFLDTLERFCRWAEEEHEVPLSSSFGEHLLSLRTSLPRAVGATRRYARRNGEDTGELYEFLAARDGDRATVRDSSGEEPSLVVGPLARELRPGDLLRARRNADDALAVYCVYPPEAAALAAGLSGRARPGSEPRS